MSSTIIKVSDVFSNIYDRAWQLGLDIEVIQSGHVVGITKALIKQELARESEQDMFDFQFYHLKNIDWMNVPITAMISAHSIKATPFAPHSYLAGTSTENGYSLYCERMDKHFVYQSNGHALTSAMDVMRSAKIRFVKEYGLNDRQKEQVFDYLDFLTYDTPIKYLIYHVVSNAAKEDKLALQG